MEIETQIMIAQKLGYLGQHESQNALSATAEVGRIIMVPGFAQFGSKRFPRLWPRLSLPTAPRHFHRPQQRLRLIHAFLKLAGRVGVGDNARSRL